jgi:hypothetical protein
MSFKNCCEASHMKGLIYDHGSAKDGIRRDIKKAGELLGSCSS